MLIRVYRPFTGAVNSTMASIEPPTTAKAVLHTTRGPIEIEIWAKETPLASRNFLQLCLNGYYDGCQFHRVVKDFVVQTGDPTNTGYGGAAIYEGESFKDEFHSRLRYSRRGIVGCANAGTKDSNGSQFMITLGPTPELNGKNTIFGRIVGDTIFNVVKISEAEVDDNDRPLYPASITHTEVLIPYFDDLDTSGPKTIATVADHQETSKPKPKKKPAVKLAYDDESSDEDEIPAKKFKIQAAADVVEASKPDKMESPVTTEKNQSDLSAKSKTTSVPPKASETPKRKRTSDSVENTSTRKPKGKKGSRDRELETLKLLESFKAKISASKPATTVEDKQDDRPKWAEDDEVPSDYEDDEKPDGFEGLSGHVFHYDGPRGGEDDDTLMVIDDRANKSG